MTAGDPISVIQLIPPENNLEIKPPVGVVWMVKNLYFGGAWALIRYKNSDTYQVFNSGVEADSIENQTMIVTHDIFWVIKNKATTNVAMGFDGLVIQ